MPEMVPAKKVMFYAKRDLPEMARGGTLVPAIFFPSANLVVGMDRGLPYACARAEYHQWVHETDVEVSRQILISGLVLEVATERLREAGLGEAVV